MNSKVGTLNLSALFARLLFSVGVLTLLIACSGDEALFSDAAFIEKNQVLSIDLVSVNEVIGVGEQETYQVLATLAGTSERMDVTHRANWSNSDNAVVTLTSKGVATGLAAGYTVVKANLGPLEASTLLSVSEAELVSIELTAPAEPANVCLQTGGLIATGYYDDGSTRTITSSVSFTAEPSENMSFPAPGDVVAIISGDYSVMASKGGVVSPAIELEVLDSLQEITLSPINYTTQVSGIVNYEAFGNYGETGTQTITDKVQWQVSGTTANNENVANLSDSPGLEGRVETLREGSVTVTAQCNGVVASTFLSVTGDDSITELVINDGEESLELSLSGNTEITTKLTLKARLTESDELVDVTDKASWFSETSGVASVSNSTGSKGLVTAKNVGESIIEAVYAGLTVQVTIEVIE